MNKKLLPYCAIAGLLSLGLPLAAVADQEVSAPEVVGAIEGAFGVNKGERRNHIKGVCALGEFVGSKDAASFAKGLQRAGYATDPAYAAKLERIITGPTLRQALIG